MNCPSTEDAQRIVAMSQHPGWHVLREAIEEEIRIRTQDLINFDHPEREYIALQYKIRALNEVILFVAKRREQVDKGGN